MIIIPNFVIVPMTSLRIPATYFKPMTEWPSKIHFFCGINRPKKKEKYNYDLNEIPMNQASVLSEA